MKDCSPLVSLLEMKEGEAGEIVRFGLKSAKDLHKFLVLGLVPGEEVRVVLKNPMVVVQLGYAQIALDKTLAAGVFIRRR